MMNGSRDAAVILLSALKSSKGKTRETLLSEALKMRDQRAAPLFGYLVRHLDRRQFPELYMTAVEALGTFGGSDAIEALKGVLHSGSLLTFFSTRGVRNAAAHALAKIGTPEALNVLRDATRTGGFFVRAAARAELGRTE
jgi:HEAT repeat protein